MSRSERIDHLRRVQLAPPPDRQAFAAERIKNVQRLKHLAVIGAAVNQTLRPDMAPAVRPQPATGSVVQPKPARLRWHYRHLQPLSPPWAPDTFAVRLPSGIPHRGRNRAIPRTAIWPGEPGHAGDQAIFARPRGSLRCAGRCWRST